MIVIWSSRCSRRFSKSSRQVDTFSSINSLKKRLGEMRGIFWMIWGREWNMPISAIQANKWTELWFDFFLNSPASQDNFIAENFQVFSTSDDEGKEIEMGFFSIKTIQWQKTVYSHWSPQRVLVPCHHLLLHFYTLRKASQFTDDRICLQVWWKLIK